MAFNEEMEDGVHSTQRTSYWPGERGGNPHRPAQGISSFEWPGSRMRTFGSGMDQMDPNGYLRPTRYCLRYGPEVRCTLILRV